MHAPPVKTQKGETRQGQLLSAGTKARTTNVNAAEAKCRSDTIVDVLERVDGQINKISMVSCSIRPLIRASCLMRSAGTSAGRPSGSTTSGPRSRSATRRPSAETVEITQTNASGNAGAADGTGQMMRSRTRRKLDLDSAEVPSLKEFVHRQTVIRQYRGFLRAVNCIPDPTFQTSSKKEVQTSFERYKKETDALTIQMALREGERQLEQVCSMVGYVGADNAAKTDGGSWLNIDDEEDPRGRVGVVWPWEEKQ